MGDLLQTARAVAALDAVLPEHVYRGTATGARFWTTSVGSFRLTFSGVGPDALVTFDHEAAGWKITVPLTVPALDALVLTMILASAIEPGALTAGIITHPTYGSIVVETDNTNTPVVIALDRPLDRIPMSSTAAYVLATRLARQASTDTHNRWVVQSRYSR